MHMVLNLEVVVGNLEIGLTFWDVLSYFYECIYDYLLYPQIFFPVLHIN